MLQVNMSRQSPQLHNVWARDFWKLGSDVSFTIFDCRGAHERQRGHRPRLQSKMVNDTSDPNFQKSRASTSGALTDNNAACLTRSATHGVIRVYENPNQNCRSIVCCCPLLRDGIRSTHGIAFEHFQTA